MTKSTYLIALGATLLGSQTYLSTTAPKHDNPTVLSEILSTDRTITKDCPNKLLPMFCTSNMYPRENSPLTNEKGKLIDPAAYVLPETLNATLTAPGSILAAGGLLTLIGSYRRRKERDL